MFEDAWQNDEDDEDVVHVTPPPPVAYVTGHLHGGPYDGATTDLMPWARVEVPFLDWSGDTLDQATEVVYRLRGTWFGGPTAHYDYVDPAVPKWFGGPADQYASQTVKPDEVETQVVISPWLVLFALVVIGFVAGRLSR